MINFESQDQYKAAAEPEEAEATPAETVVEVPTAAAAAAPPETEAKPFVIVVESEIVEEVPTAPAAAAPAEEEEEVQLRRLLK